MKYLTLTLALLLFTLFPAEAIKKIEANPINIAAMLAQETDTASMAATCDYYGYLPQPSQNGYTVFKHPNGSMIRFIITDSDAYRNYPTIEVTSKATQKEKENIIEDLQYRKVGNTFEKRHIGFTTRCSSGPRGSLRFTSHPKQKIRDN